MDLQNPNVVRVLEKTECWGTWGPQLASAMIKTAMDGYFSMHLTVMRSELGEISSLGIVGGF
jgi:hypothetical protein